MRTWKKGKHSLKTQQTKNVENAMNEEPVEYCSFKRLVHKQRPVDRTATASDGANVLASTALPEGTISVSVCLDTKIASIGHNLSLLWGAGRAPFYFAQALVPWTLTGRRSRGVRRRVCRRYVRLPLPPRTPRGEARTRRRSGCNTCALLGERRTVVLQIAPALENLAGKKVLLNIVSPVDPA